MSDCVLSLCIYQHAAVLDALMHVAVDDARAVPAVVEPGRRHHLAVGVRRQVGVAPRQARIVLAVTTHTNTDSTRHHVQHLRISTGHE